MELRRTANDVDPYPLLNLVYDRDVMAYLYQATPRHLPKVNILYH